MLGKLLPLIVILVALAGGAAAGFVLRPEDEEAAPATPIRSPVPQDERVVTLRDSFIVPVLRDGRVWGHVVLTLGIEAVHVSRDTILLQEPVLRDGLTEALFRYGSLGGFDGDFTDAIALNRLRTRLNEVVVQRLGDDQARILVISMARQDG
ncbi:hypothetical protein ACK8OR_11005 [Jannaschia sp. KMU-145]|uniref:hypothetical protein n=1 Tax=Jannaschia halovivens TaxID=3388667 RepID=UPI00396B131D